MSDVPPPWARPRAGEPAQPPAGHGDPIVTGPVAPRRPPASMPDLPRTTRRVPGDAPGQPRNAGNAPGQPWHPGDASGQPGNASTPSAPGGPPPGRRPPPMPAASGPSASDSTVGPDPRVGLVAGRVHVDRPEWTIASSPGLVAAAGAAVLATLAVLVRAALGDVDGFPLLVGIVGPVLVVAVCAGVQWRSRRTGSDAVLRFTVRTATGRSVSHTMRADQSRQALATGDLVRVVTGPRGAVRAVEVLATLGGPVLRRLTRLPVMTPAQWAGAAAAAGLLLATAALLMP